MLVEVGVGVGTEVSLIVIVIFSPFHSVLPVLDPASSTVNVCEPSNLKSALGFNGKVAIPFEAIVKVPSADDNPSCSAFEIA